MYLFNPAWIGEIKGFPPSTLLGMLVGLMVKRLVRKKAHACADSGTAVAIGFAGFVVIQGTIGLPASDAKPPAIPCCAVLGAKILLCVSSGTASWASDRRPS